MKRSPLAPAEFPALAPLDGVRLGAIESGVKYHGRDDLMLAVLSPQTTVAGVLTQSATAAAPVRWCRHLLESECAPRALIVNAGNANAFTGDAGARAVRATCDAVAAAIDCDAEQVFAASTGVIGEPLPVERIVDAMPQLAASLGADAAAWARAAQAILTTDTFAKGATARAQIAGAPVTINGFAKGSGMIEPNMATMLAFVFTDAAIPRATLQAMLVAANAKSFNAISVDGDTSTSDTCLLFATGCADHPPIAEAELDDFQRALEEVMIDLAVQIVRDGEGASKLIRIEVRGARDDDARAVAKSIANSPLVKTAIAGGDANWGRVVMAIGNAGVALDPSRVAIAIGGVAVAAEGRRVENYEEAPVNAHLAGSEVLIEVELGAKSAGHACVWTCDLTHGYIEINADYRS